MSPYRGSLSLKSFRGGDEQARTVDPLLAKQVLFQLSYTPVYLRLRGLLHPLN